MCLALRPRPHCLRVVWLDVLRVSASSAVPLLLPLLLFRVTGRWFRVAGSAGPAATRIAESMMVGRGVARAFSTTSGCDLASRPEVSLASEQADDWAPQQADEELTSESSASVRAGPRLGSAERAAGSSRCACSAGAQAALLLLWSQMDSCWAHWCALCCRCCRWC